MHALLVFKARGNERMEEELVKSRQTMEERNKRDEIRL